MVAYDRSLPRIDRLGRTGPMLMLVHCGKCGEALWNQVIAADDPGGMDLRCYCHLVRLRVPIQNYEIEVLEGSLNGQSSGGASSRHSRTSSALPAAGPKVTGCMHAGERRSATGERLAATAHRCRCGRGVRMVVDQYRDQGLLAGFPALLTGELTDEAFVGSRSVS